MTDTSSRELVSENDASPDGNGEDSLDTLVDAVTDAIHELQSVRDRVDDVERRIDRDSLEAVEAATRAYRNAMGLLESYEDRATGTGRETFKAYVQLEGEFATLVENLPADLRQRDAFESALDAIDKRRLSESDFDRAREALEPAATYADLLEERESARNSLGTARSAANRLLRELETELDKRERLLALATVDLDAPVENLREPIETYNDAIRDAFETYLRDESAREVFEFLDRTRWYPFVEYDTPPSDLERYVTSNPVGEQSIPDLLEYASYSRSKLDHYVDDADELKRQIATQQTYLEGIDAEPLTISWPPFPAPVLRRRTRELVPLVARVADESAVTDLRSVRELTFDPTYDRLQTAAQAVSQLDPAERRRLAEGHIDDEINVLEAQRDRLQDALETDESA